MKLSVIVLTKDNQDTVKACLTSVAQADEIIIVDDFSTDQTLKLAKPLATKIFSLKITTFPHQRQWAVKKITGDWFMFLDADEQLPPRGWQELTKILPATTHSAFRFKRQNFFYGQKIRHGGYWPDYQTRIFKTADFKGVQGVTHEKYVFTGTLGTLSEPVLHHPDRSVQRSLYKTMIWTQKEAEALFKAHHPPVTWWRIVKVMLSEFCYRYFKKQGFKEGYIGFTDSLTQAINKFFIYQQLWELQQS